MILSCCALKLLCFFCYCFSPPLLLCPPTLHHAIPIYSFVIISMLLYIVTFSRRRRRRRVFATLLRFAPGHRKRRRRKIQYAIKYIGLCFYLFPFFMRDFIERRIMKIEKNYFQYIRNNQAFNNLRK